MKTENILPDLTTPRVMAIVNVTPDSFFAGSRTPDAEAIERRVREAAGAGLASEAMAMAPSRL